MAKSRPPVITETYLAESRMRRDIERKLADGYIVQSTNITEHRGCATTFLGLITLGILLFVLPKDKHYHVTYVLAPPPPPPAPNRGYTGF